MWSGPERYKEIDVNVFMELPYVTSVNLHLPLLAPYSTYLREVISNRLDIGKSRS